MKRPQFPKDRLNSKLHISKYGYFTKKFQGFVLSFDFDMPQYSSRTLLFSFQFKFAFFGCWLNIYRNH